MFFVLFLDMFFSVCIVSIGFSGQLLASINDTVKVFRTFFLGGGGGG